MRGVCVMRVGWPGRQAALSCGVLLAALTMPVLQPSSADAGSRSHVLVRQYVRAGIGAYVRARSGQAIFIPADVMSKSGFVTIKSVRRGVYDVHIGPRWKGTVAVTMRLRRRTDTVIHDVGGVWLTEGSGRGARTVWVTQLSRFSTILSKARNALSGALCLTFDLQQLTDCVLKKVAKHVDGKLVSWIESRIPQSCTTQLVEAGVTSVGGGPKSIVLSVLRAAFAGKCVGQAGEATYRIPTGAPANPAPGSVPAGGSGGGQAIVNAAASQAGRPYCFDGGNTSGPTHGAGDYGNGGCPGATQGFDCTGLTLYAVYQATRKVLTHDGRQATEGGQIITNQADLLPGDLVFFGGTLNNFEHAGVYAGNGVVWDAADYNVRVQEHTLKWIEAGLPFVGAVRLWSGAGTGTGVPPLGTANPNSPGAFVDSSGNYNVFVTTSGGINHYEKGPGGSWGGEVVATGSFTSAPVAFVDSSGNYNVFATTSGGVNHYERGGGGWGGEVVATGQFNAGLSAFADSSGNYNVFATTSGGLNHYERGGGGWGGEVVATP